jgi:hypothetical protein
VMFDGKFGIWPFVEVVAARRSSRNRLAGTPELKPVSVTRLTYKRMLLDHVFPKIYELFPSNIDTIVLQHDNATPHAITVDHEIVDACGNHGRKIVFGTQPANSPDLNILDLGFFNAIQSLQTKMPAYNIGDLIRNVRLAYDNTLAVTLENVFYTLQSVMNSIVECGGRNNFKITHLGKEAKRRRGELQESIEWSSESYLSVRFSSTTSIEL